MITLENLARTGYRIFPVGAHKRPLTEHGFKDAKSGEEGLALCRQYKTDYVAIATGLWQDGINIFVVDCDVYKPGGEADEAEFLAAIGDLSTYTIKTQSGGLHYYFWTTEEIGSPSLANTIEIKGIGGYVVSPPSPGYEPVNDNEIAEAPRALLDLIKAKQTSYGAKSKSALLLEIQNGNDLHNNLRSFIKRLAEEGKPVEQITPQVLDALAVAQRNPIVTQERAVRVSALLANHQNELSRLIDGALAKYHPKAGVDEISARLSAAGAHLFAAQANSQPTVVEPPPITDDSWYFAAQATETEVKPLLLAPWVHVGDVIVLSAAPKAGKTTFALDMALSMGAGLPVAGSDLRPLGADGELGRHTVVYYALEGQEAVRTRIKAWLGAKGLDASSDVRVVVAPVAVNLTTEEGRAKVVNDLKNRSQSWQASQGWGPIALVVFDTLTKVMPGKDQNTVEDTSEVFQITNDIRAALGNNVAVLFVHHDDKTGRGPRGSSNITAEPDLVLRLGAVDPASLPPGTAAQAALSVRVAMARSIDLGSPRLFAVDSVSAGVTSQGIERAAPVLRSLDHLPLGGVATSPLRGAEKPADAVGSPAAVLDRMIATRALEIILEALEGNAGSATFREIDAAFMHSEEPEIKRYYMKVCKITRNSKIPLVARMKALRTNLMQYTQERSAPFAINSALGVITS